ncbi:hypothetical protein WJX73_005758 [Symbiochloris irregularis]|uniref:F-box domain-containing protein n=1 Tax=Symbiochloris irregularis TaxID=706552 RepID=A0AAW1NQD5_9CHLO
MRETKNSQPPRQIRTVSNRMILPEELLLLVFKKLPLQTLLRAELCCREWRRLLSSPQARGPWSGLWGHLEIELDKLATRVSRNQSTPSLTPADLLPTCRWLAAHARGGIPSLTLKTTMCFKCIVAEYPDEHHCQSSAEELQGAVVALLASLHSSAVELRVHFEGISNSSAWPTNRRAMLQQAMADRLVSLTLQEWLGPDRQEFDSICGLTRLTGLQLGISGFSPGLQQPLTGLTSLPRLRQLEVHIKEVDHWNNWDFFLHGLGPALGHFTTLTSLHIAASSSGTSPGVSPSHLHALSRLQDLRFNYIDITDFNAPPSSSFGVGGSVRAARLAARCSPADDIIS